MSKIKTTESVQEKECAWESGQLGTSIEHARPAPDGHSAVLDESLAMQLISVRLPKELIDDLKYLASKEGLGYQPLMRRVLMRFVAHEFKNIAQDQFVGELRQQKKVPKPKKDPEPERPLARAAG